MRFLFGDFDLDTRQGQLRNPEGPVVLRRQAWKLLLALLEAAPALVERDVLLDRVWGRSALSPNVLPQTLSELRQALGDSARDPRYIETCHGRGYRLICEVRREQDAAAPGLPRATRPGWRPSPAVLVAGLILLPLILMLWLGSQREPGSGIELDGTLRRQAEAALLRHDPASAAAQFRALVALLPDDEEVRLSLAEAELDALQTEQARQTLSLIGADRQLREEPRWLLAQARLADLDGRADQAGYQAEAALVQAVALGEVEAAARAVALKAQLLQRAGDLGGAATVLEDGLNLPLLRDSDSLSGRLALKRVALLREQGDQAGARAELKTLKARALPVQLGQQALIEGALLLAADGRPDAAWTDLLELADQLQAGDPPELQIAMDNAIGAVGVEVGEFDRALAAFERALSLARRTGDGQRVAGIQVNAGSLLARRDRFVEAERLWQAALDIFEQSGDRRGHAVVLGNMAAAASAQGLNERSRSLNEQALAIFRDLGLDGPRARTAFNLAVVAAREGRLAAADELLAEAQDGYAQGDQVDLLLHVGAFRIDHRLLAGDAEAAAALLAALYPDLARGSPLRQAAVYASRARLALWQGDLDAARAAFKRARELREESGQDTWVATSELELLSLDLLAGVEPWRIRVAASELAQVFEARGQARAAARARLLMSEALLSVGEVEQARRELETLDQVQAHFVDVSLALDIDWVAAWASRPEERTPRLESLARRAAALGFGSMLDRIEAANGVERSYHPPLPPYAQTH